MYLCAQAPGLFKIFWPFMYTCKYDVTTPDPGQRLRLTNFGMERPDSTAFLANNPAVNITLGLLVLLLEAIDDIKTVPFWME